MSLKQSGHISTQYTKKALPLSLTRRILRKQQQKIYEKFISLVPIHPDQKILDYGVNGSLTEPKSYFFEYNYPFKKNIVACGLESDENFHSCFPEIKYRQVSRDLPLPFRDKEYDFVFCNAVIEHVGSRQIQELFLVELIRIGKAIFLTTPNRWYPVELHTVLPLLHYLPSSIYRKIYAMIGFTFFSQEKNLNLLDIKTLKNIVPLKCSYNIYRHHFLGLTSNLILLIEQE